MSKSIPP